MTRYRCKAWSVLSVALLMLFGCGLSIPADPDQTLERVSGGVLRVGASPSEPWIIWGAEREPSGREADLVRRFAESIDAQIEWTRGGEEALIDQMERGELDLVAGGLTAESPWMKKAAITKPYVAVPTPHGTEKHVLAAPLGENAFLVALERFLLAQEPPDRR